jgi:hypothetical protein
MLTVMISARIKREENSNGRHMLSPNEQIFFAGGPYVVRQIAQKVDKKAGGSQ